MAKEILMPQLSDTMDRGKILQWYKKEGEKISRGDVLAEVETDKANLEIESFDEGYLLKILVKAGEEASVGNPIAVIGEEGEEYSPQNKGGDQKDAEKEPQENEKDGFLEESKSVEVKEISGRESLKHEVKKETTPKYEGDRIKISPLARKLAEEKGISINNLKGSGPGGRIIKKDVESAMRDLPAKEEYKRPEYTQEEAVIPLDKMRATIARRMQESISEIPHFYSTVSANMEQCVNLRKILKNEAGYEGISFNHFVIKACARALLRYPRLRSRYEKGNIITPSAVNIGVVTAVEDGLLIPVIHGVDKMSLQDVVVESNSAVQRARSGNPSSKDLTGGNFTISNLGMFGVESFTAIINPGQGAILAVAKIDDKVIPINGIPLIKPMMTMTLSVDHRIIDGVMAAQFLNAVKEGLENPALIMV